MQAFFFIGLILNIFFLLAWFWTVTPVRQPWISISTSWCKRFWDRVSKEKHQPGLIHITSWISWPAPASPCSSSSTPNSLLLASTTGPVGTSWTQMDKDGWTRLSSLWIEIVSKRVWEIFHNKGSPQVQRMAGQKRFVEGRHKVWHALDKRLTEECLRRWQWQDIGRWQRLLHQIFQPKLCRP